MLREAQLRALATLGGAIGKPYFGSGSPFFAERQQPWVQGAGRPGQLSGERIAENAPLRLVRVVGRGRESGAGIPGDDTWLYRSRAG